MSHDLSWHLGRGPVEERQRLNESYDELGTARCPLCRGALVARMGPAGPYFHCHCAEKKASEPAAAVPRRCA